MGKPILLLFLWTALVRWRCSAENYAVPANAIRIEAEELEAEHPTLHLMHLLGNRSIEHLGNQHQRFESKETEEEEEQSDDVHFPTALLRLETLLRLAEERKQRLESSGRLLSINRGSYFRGLLIVWVPVSFILPTLAHHSYNRYRSRSGHIKEHLGSHRLQSSSYASNEIKYDPSTPDYQFEKNYGPLLSRLEGYFSLLRIKDVSCRWKLLCHVGREADEYQPLSNLFGRLFERSNKFPRPEIFHPALKKFFTYMWAEKKGRKFSTPGQCDEEYAGCPATVPQLIRTDMLLFWQKLAKRFAIQLQDE